MGEDKIKELSSRINALEFRHKLEVQKLNHKLIELKFLIVALVIGVLVPGIGPIILFLVLGEIVGAFLIRFFTGSTAEEKFEKDLERIRQRKAREQKARA